MGQKTGHRLFGVYRGDIEERHLSVAGLDQQPDLGEIHAVEHQPCLSDLLASTEIGVAGVIAPAR